MTPEQRSEVETKVAEIDAARDEIRDAIQKNTAAARILNGKNRELMEKREALSVQRSELVKLLEVPDEAPAE